MKSKWFESQMSKGSLRWEAFLSFPAPPQALYAPSRAGVRRDHDGEAGNSKQLFSHDSKISSEIRVWRPRPQLPGAPGPPWTLRLVNSSLPSPPPSASAHSCLVCVSVF